MRLRKTLKIGLSFAIIIFILLNIAIIVQAYSLSHFKEGIPPLTPDYKPGFTESIRIAILGLDMPKPTTKLYPTQPYDSLYIPAGEGKHLDAWLLHTNSMKKGLVIAFHGYMDEKSSMLDRSEIYLNEGYDVLLVNFMGAGTSYGNQTTMGYLEAENVKSAHDFAINELQEDNIILAGFSMGAVAIMKAQHDYNLLVKAIILEAPYATFTETVNARLDKLHVPHFPITNMFTFWFGKINGFDAFEANPLIFGKKINVPVMLMCGGKDPYIPQDETQKIFDHIGSEHKQLKIFSESVHETYLLKYHDEWRDIIHSFLSKLEEMDVYN
ncbi:alpha/beta hydrolase [Dysgonomonas sp. Marseille-P4677]|uniref:alpha/beta hydrolase n=1 Tax=Dysgonomonas sp. Marseille-P4677 TaxID=2364790 RepID=UPI001913D058|nr:alpha/beta fold hydrolase [Dysgonomonas sp. Marseille-P4677]MBK5722215.1 alpha/beta hydrolase [Dysgonomonas sp. Marseille-P4677]